MFWDPCYLVTSFCLILTILYHCSVNKMKTLANSRIVASWYLIGCQTHWLVSCDAGTLADANKTLPNTTPIREPGCRRQPIRREHTISWYRFSPNRDRYRVSKPDVCSTFAGVSLRVFDMDSLLLYITNEHLSVHASSYRSIEWIWITHTLHYNWIIMIHIDKHIHHYGRTWSCTVPYAISYASNQQGPLLFIIMV